MNQTSQSANAQREQHRARYEALRQTAQNATAKALPPKSSIGLPIPGATLHQETVPGGWYWTTRLRPGESLRICTPTGTSTVSMVAWSVADASERINTADTIKLQWSAALRKGRLLLTDMGRVAFSIVEDSSGAHDSVVGPTTSASTKAVPDTSRNSRDNFLAAAAKLGLSRRDVPMCVSFFAPVAVDEAGHFVWHGDRRQAGDFVDLRAEMDLWLVLSNASHPLDPSLGNEPAPVELTIFESPTPTSDDACRNAGVEAERAFIQTARLAPRVATGAKS